MIEYVYWISGISGRRIVIAAAYSKSPYCGETQTAANEQGGRKREVRLVVAERGHKVNNEIT